MWVFTEDGFFSTVVWQFDGTVVQEWLAVRSRAEDNLISFINKMDDAYTTDDIICTPDRDYPWRILVRRGDWAKYLSDYATDDLTYTDFKSHVRLGTVHSDPSRLHALAEVWGVMYDDYARRPNGDEVKFSKSSAIWNRIGRGNRDE
tara:strand:- start:479 stop:919 length:441 start_codon:yes stop_codon:yes gene_type:complete